MRRQDIVRRYRQLMEKITPQLLLAGIDATTIGIAIDVYSDEAIVNYTERVTNLTISGGAYHSFMSIYGLQSVAWWKNMELLGETKLREHKLLSVEKKKLRSAWRKMNNGFAKIAPKSDAAQGNPEAGGIRSES